MAQPSQDSKYLPQNHQATAQAAASSHDIPTFQALLDHGWDINALDSYGCPILPLVVADPSTLAFFLDHGADPNLGASHFNKLPATVQAAAASASVASMQLLLAHGARLHDAQPLHAAASAANLDMIDFLVAQGCDVNELDRYQPGPRHMGTPLHHAGEAVLNEVDGAVEAIRRLLKHGADKHRKNNYGTTPIDWVRGQRERAPDEIEELLGDGKAADTASKGSCLLM